MEILFEQNMTQIGIAIAVLIASFVLRVAFRKTIFKALEKYSDKQDKQILAITLVSIRRPVDFLFIVIGFAIAVNILPIEPHYGHITNQIIRSLFIFTIFWGFFSIVEPLSRIVNDLSNKSENLLTQTAARLFSKIFKFLIAAIAIVMILQEWGYNVTGFVASLGLVGMAFALAAKDTAANLFGSIVVFSDKPFVIGDWVKINDNEGHVEDITIRSTMIRKFDQALITMPNSNLTSSSITNFSRMQKRQIKITLGLTYSTNAIQLQRIISNIRDYLASNEKIDQEIIHVYFHDLDTSSLGIFCYFFTKTTNWGEYMQVREDVNFEIMKIVEQNGAHFAYPTQTIILEKSSI